MVLIINIIIIYHSRMIRALRFIEISKYDDGGQLLPAVKLCLEAVEFYSTIVAECQFEQLLKYTLTLKWEFKIRSKLGKYVG